MESILTESALAVVQSGGESAQLKMIEGRLKKEDEDLVKIIEELRVKEGNKALNTALGAFYIKATEKEGGVEFYHKSFSEFLWAKRLYRSLEDWAEKGSRRNKWYIDDEQLAIQVYDLLGYGGLSWEIVEYLRGLLDKNTNLPETDDNYFSVESVKNLFNRLYDFYLRWCDGEFIDAEDIILPHIKMRELKPYVSGDTKLGQRQVDVFTGLNVMILLLELHRYGQDSDNEKLKQQLNFHPCGEVDKDGKPKDNKSLLRIISYSNCLGITTFNDTVGNFLEYANLEGSNLEATYLCLTNLSNANLHKAKLDRANLKDITWNKNTNWEEVQGLETAINVPEKLKRQLGL